jgi:electron transport complex protein RnfC
VKKGDAVKVGQPIALPGPGPLGLPVHASISGKVTDVVRMAYTGDTPVMCVLIENDFHNTWIDGIYGQREFSAITPESIIPAIRDAGICGMGGASFPTHVKLSIPEGARCDIIIINGTECETFLTADDRLMRETPMRIVNGLRLVMRALSVSRGVIAIEDNKPEALKSILAASANLPGIEVKKLRTSYPQGGEKQLILTVTGREVPSGKLPVAVNAVVLNVATSAAIADAVLQGKPLIERVTTIAGCVKTPANLLLRNGTIIGDAIGECGGYAKTPGKIALGGGMTGICAPNDQVPMTISTSGIVVYDEEEAQSLDEQPCIRCGKCVGACPSGLRPYILKHYCDEGDLIGAQSEHVLDCIVCGSCSYECPAQRWLTASFKNMKDKLALAAKGGNGK